MESTVEERGFAESKPPLLRAVRALWVLSKPGITAMNLLMVAGGYWLAIEKLNDRSPFDLSHLLTILLAAGGVISGSCYLNMFLERERDKLMARTKERPLPQGDIPAHYALILGVLGVVVGGMLFAVQGAILSGVLALGASVIYVLIYTPLKRKTPLHIPIGALAGATPPLLGWAAVTDRIDWPGIALFLFLFLWQIPHTLSLLSLYRDDYLKGEISVDWIRSEKREKLFFVLSALPLPFLALLLVSAGLGGYLSAGLIGLFGSYIFWKAVVSDLRVRSEIRKIFLNTVFFLPFSITVLIVEHAIW